MRDPSRATRICAFEATVLEKVTVKVYPFESSGPTVREAPGSRHVVDRKTKAHRGLKKEAKDFRDMFQAPFFVLATGRGPGKILSHAEWGSFVCAKRVVGPHEHTVSFLTRSNCFGSWDCV